MLATLVSVAGSSYRRPGARLLVRADGSRLGSVSGGCLEEDVLARAERVRASGVAEAAVYDTTAENDLVWGVGLGCHGVVRVLIEPVPFPPAWAAAVANAAERRARVQLVVTHEHGSPSGWGTRLREAAAPVGSAGGFAQEFIPPPSLAIFGAGDDAIPLARLALLGGKGASLRGKVRQDALRAFPRAEQADVAQPAREQVAQDGHVVHVVVGHHDRDAAIGGG
ncbi:MAG: XdhC family protein [Opitutaceae bacterium]